MELERRDSSGGTFLECDSQGYLTLAAPAFEYNQLNHDTQEQRFLTLFPSTDEPGKPLNHVRTELKTWSLANAPPFIAVSNARGYRLLTEPIEVNGAGLYISSSLAVFLRHFRVQITEPKVLWIRHICVNQPDSQERERYWTREWSDKIYNLATEVVNMHMFNATLIEDGKARKMVDGRFMEWKKEWYGNPEVVLPKVFPIQLGGPLSNEAPTRDFEYVPLDLVADEIRVLVVVPFGEDESSPIVAHLGHCPIKCEVNYIALSYRWGSGTATAELVLNGQKKLIQSDLELTLRTLRYKDRPLCIWVDAISINQDDILEKSRQVPRMGEIFDNAAVVLSHVGLRTPDTDLALELIRELQEPMMRFNDKGEWHFGPWNMRENGHGIEYGENRISPDRLARMGAALYKFLTRPYFRRTWICQEIAMASSPYLAIDRDTYVELDRFDKAVYNFLDMLRSDLTLPGAIARADSSIPSVDTDMLAFPRKLFYFRHLMSGGRNTTMLIQAAKIRENSPGYLESLVLARDCESTDPRDKILALWNLARDKQGMVFSIDYNLSIKDTYIEFARAWMRQRNSLDIIATSECLSRNSEFAVMMPSWSPDWSVPAQTSCLVRRERLPVYFMAVVSDQDGPLYSADGFSDDHPVNNDETSLFEFEGDVLCCTGIILDEILFVLDDVPEIPNGAIFPYGCEPLSYHAARHWTAELTSHYEANPSTVYDDPLQAVTAMFNGDVPTAWPRADQNPDNVSDSHPEELYVCLPSRARHIEPYADSYRRTDAWDAIATVLRGRRPFISRGGYMGLVPTHVVDQGSGGPWLLAIIAGCSTPLLLRERENGLYQLCGSCFVQGWMEGEILTELLGAEKPSEVWVTLKEGEKLKIS